MSERVYNVLFLCTHNSARSVIAECIINRLGGGKFRGFSAGSTPRGQIHPYALDLLAKNNYDVAGLRSKSWDEFAAPGAPGMDFVFTVCDDAANEVCPMWPGQPMTAHWGLRSKPGGRDGGGKTPRFRRYAPHALSAHWHTREPADGVTRPACASKEARRDRQVQSNG